MPMMVDGDLLPRWADFCTPQKVVISQTESITEWEYLKRVKRQVNQDSEPFRIFIALRHWFQGVVN